MAADAENLAKASHNLLMKMVEESSKKMAAAFESELERSSQRFVAELESASSKLQHEFDASLVKLVNKYEEEVLQIRSELNAQGLRVSALEVRQAELDLVVKEATNSTHTALEHQKTLLDSLKAGFEVLKTQVASHIDTAGNNDAALARQKHGNYFPDADIELPENIPPEDEHLYSAIKLYKANLACAKLGKPTGSLSEPELKFSVVKELNAEFLKLLKTATKYMHTVIVSPILLPSDELPKKKQFLEPEVNEPMQGTGEEMEYGDSGLRSGRATQVRRMKRIEALKEHPLTSKSLEDFIRQHVPDASWNVVTLSEETRLFKVTFVDKVYPNRSAARLLQRRNELNHELRAWVKHDEPLRLRAMRENATNFGWFLRQQLPGEWKLKPRMLDNHLVLGNLVVAPSFLIPEDESAWPKLRDVALAEFRQARRSWLAIAQRASPTVTKWLHNYFETGDHT